MAHNAIAVANYFINKGIEENNLLTPMKVQKLVYIAHGWHLAALNEPLIEDKVGAWPFGPVIGSIYKEFADYSRKKIDAPREGYILETNPQTSEILDAVWGKYKALSATALSNMTHSKGSPWEQAYQEGISNIISNDVIKSHYKELLN